MSHVRGITFTGIIKYVRRDFGEEGFRKVLEGMPEKERNVLNEPLHPMEWYPQEIFVSFMTSAEKALGKENYNVCYLMGKTSAAEAFGGIYKIFLEFGGPQALLKKAALAWRALNDTGYLEIEFIKNNYAKGKIKEYENPNKCLCWYLCGYFEKVIELSGGSNVKIKETKCRCAGDDCCEYETSWE